MITFGKVELNKPNDIITGDNAPETFLEGGFHVGEEGGSVCSGVYAAHELNYYDLSVITYSNMLNLQINSTRKDTSANEGPTGELIYKMQS